jgi:hypothetical protein
MVTVHPHPRKETSESTALPSMSIAQIDEALTRFVLQDTANLRQATDQIASDDRRSASDISSLVERVTVASLERLDDVIVDLRYLRDLVHTEGGRIQRELSGFVKLNRDAMASADLIAQSTRHWKETRSAEVGRHWIDSEVAGTAGHVSRLSPQLRE